MAEYGLGTAHGVVKIDYDGNGIDQAKTDMDSIDKKGDKTGKALQKTSTGMLLVGGAIAGGLALAANSAADFESRISAVAAVSGATGPELDKIRDKALQLGKDTKYSATEAATAMEELVKAGLTVPDVMNGAADATVALAAAGEIALPEAATISANAMNQFGLSAAEMPKIADLIAGAANASAIDVGEFGFSLSQAGAVANLAGLSFDDTAVAIAEMGNAGIKGSDAGTSLKSFLSNLIPTTDKAMGVMEEMGLLTIDTGTSMKALAEKGIKPASSSMEDITSATAKYIEKTTGAKVGTDKNTAATQKFLKETLAMNNAFFDANGNTKSLAEIQGLLAKSTKGMTKEQKLANLEVLFGSDAIRAAAVLADNGAEGYNKMAGAMSKVTAADVAAKRMDNLKGSLEQMKGSLETAGIAIGTILLPPIRKVVDFVTMMLNKFLALSDGTKKVITYILLAAGTFLLLGGGLIKAVGYFTKLQDTMKILNGGFGLFSKQGRIAMAITKVWTGIQAAFNAVMAANPIALIIIAVIALVAAFVIAYKKSETFRNFVNAALQKIKAVALSVFGWFKDTALPWMKKAWDGIVAAGKVVVSWITTTLLPIFVSAWSKIKAAALAVVNWFQTSVLPVFRRVWAGILNGVKAFLQWFNANVAPTFRAVFGVVSKIVGAVVNFFRNKFKPGVAGAVNGVKGPLQTIMGVFKTVFSVIVSVVKVAMAILVPIFKVAFAVIKTVVSVALKVLIPIFKFVFGFIVGYIKLVFGIIRGIIELALGIIRAIFGGGLGGIKTAFTTIFGSIINFLRTVFAPVLGIFSAVWNGIKAFITGTLNAIKAVFTGIFNAIKAVVSFVFNAIKTAITIYINIWKKIITTVLNVIKGVFSRVWNGIVAIIKFVFNTIKTTINFYINLVKNIISAAWGFIKRVFEGWKAIATKVREVFVNAFNNVKEWIGKIKDKVLEIKDKILGVFSGAKDWLFDIGKKIIQGLIDGVKNMFGTVKDTLGNLTSKLTSWKGPEQKDAKLLIPAGQLIIKGLDQGFVDNIPMIKKRLQGLTKDVPKWMEGDKAKVLIAKQTMIADERRKQESMRRDKMRENAYRQAVINFHNYGLKNQTPADANARQLRSARLVGAFR